VGDDNDKVFVTFASKQGTATMTNTMAMMKDQDARVSPQGTNILKLRIFMGGHSKERCKVKSSNEGLFVNV
jgi:hypothetical protein